MYPVLISIALVLSGELFAIGEPTSCEKDMTEFSSEGLGLAATVPVTIVRGKTPPVDRRPAGENPNRVKNTNPRSVPNGPETDPNKSPSVPLGTYFPPEDLRVLENHARLGNYRQFEQRVQEFPIQLQKNPIVAKLRTQTLRTILEKPSRTVDAQAFEARAATLPEGLRTHPTVNILRRNLIINALQKHAHAGDSKSFEETAAQLQRHEAIRDHAQIDALRDRMLQGKSTPVGIRMTVDGLSKRNQDEFILRLVDQVERTDSPFEKNVYRAALELAKANKLWALKPLLNKLVLYKEATAILGQRSTNNSVRITAKLALEDPILAKDIIVNGYRESAHDPGFANRVIDELASRENGKGALNLIRWLNPEVDAENRDLLAKLSFTDRLVDRLSGLPPKIAEAAVIDLLKEIDRASDYKEVGEGLVKALFETQGHRLIIDSAQELSDNHNIHDPILTIEKLIGPPIEQAKTRIEALAHGAIKDTQRSGEAQIGAIAALIRTPEQDIVIRNGHTISGNDRRALIQFAIGKLDNGSRGSLDRVFDLWKSIDSDCKAGTCVVAPVLSMDVLKRVVLHRIATHPNGPHDIAALIGRVDTQDSKFLTSLITELASDSHNLPRLLRLAEAIDAQNTSVRALERTIDHVTHMQVGAVEKTVQIIRHYGQGPFHNPKVLDEVHSHIAKNNDYEFHGHLLDRLGNEGFYREHIGKLHISDPNQKLPTEGELQQFESYVRSGNIHFVLGKLKATEVAVAGNRATPERIDAFADAIVRASTTSMRGDPSRSIRHPETLDSIWKQSSSETRGALAKALGETKHSTEFVLRLLERSAEEAADYFVAADQSARSNTAFGKFIQDNTGNPESVAMVLHELHNNKKYEEVRSDYSQRLFRAINEMEHPSYKEQDVFRAQAINSLMREVEKSNNNPSVIEDLVQGFHRDFGQTNLHAHLIETISDSSVLARFKKEEARLQTSSETEPLSEKQKNIKTVEQISTNKSVDEVLDAWAKVYQEDSVEMTPLKVRIGTVQKKVESPTELRVALSDLAHSLPIKAAELTQVLLSHKELSTDADAIRELGNQIDLFTKSEDEGIRAAAHLALVQLDIAAYRLDIESGDRSREKKARKELTNLLAKEPDEETPKGPSEVLAAIEALSLQPSRGAVHSAYRFVTPKKYTIRFSDAETGETRMSENNTLVHFINEQLGNQVKDTDKIRLVGVLDTIAKTREDLVEAKENWAKTEAADKALSRALGDRGGMNPLARIKNSALAWFHMPTARKKIVKDILKNPIGAAKAAFTLAGTTIFASFGAWGLWSSHDDDKEDENETTHAHGQTPVSLKNSAPKKPNDEEFGIQWIIQQFASQAASTGAQSSNETPTASLLRRSKKDLEHLRYHLIRKIQDPKVQKEMKLRADVLLQTASDMLVDPSELDLNPTDPKLDQQKRESVRTNQAAAASINYDITRFESEIHVILRRQQSQEEQKRANELTQHSNPLRSSVGHIPNPYLVSKDR